MLPDSGLESDFNYISIKLSDIIPELLSMEIWDLRINDLSITLKCT